MTVSDDPDTQFIVEPDDRMPSLAMQIQAASRECSVFETGKRAHRAGASIEDCPHVSGSESAALWLQGFAEARQARERRDGF